MSRISQEMASTVAYKLTEKSKSVADKLHIEYRKSVSEFYKSTLPKAVLAFFKTEHCEYVETTNSVILDGHGFSDEYVSLIGALPSENGSTPRMPFDTNDGAKFIAAKRKWEKANKEYKALKDETKQALLALKTFNNIRKELPEAAQYLPPPMSNALVVNFDSLHKRLKAQEKLSEKTETVSTN
jgi:hypothetical protein